MLPGRLSEKYDTFGERSPTGVTFPPGGGGADADRCTGDRVHATLEDVLYLPAMMTLQKNHVRFVPCDQSSLSLFATIGQVRLRVGQSEQLVGGFYV